MCITEDNKNGRGKSEQWRPLAVSIFNYFKSPNPNLIMKKSQIDNDQLDPFYSLLAEEFLSGSLFSW